MAESGVAVGELDARTSLALERTYLSHDRNLLAWVRSAITLITFGFTIHHFFKDGQSGSIGQIGPLEFGFAMILIGLAGLILSAFQYLNSIRNLRLRYPQQPMGISYTLYLSALVCLLSIGGLVSVMSGP